MDYLFTFAVVMLVVLIGCILAYSHITNSIIRDQEKQIAKLNTEVFRLQAKLKRAQERRNMPAVVEIHDSRIDPKNIPNFNDI